MDDIVLLLNPILPWLVPILVLAVIGLIIGAFLLTGRRGGISKERLASSGTASATADVIKSPVPLALREASLALGKIFSPISTRVVPTDFSITSDLRRRLVQAGYHKPSAVGWYYVIRILMAIGLPAVSLTVVPLAVGGMSIPVALFMVASAGLLGLYFPTIYITQRTKALQTTYRNAFPDVLDLLLVCVEAGLGLDASIGRVAGEIGSAHPALGINLKLLESELRAGKSRQEALKSLADRLGIDEARSLVTLLLQSEELGSSIADALRVYSEEMRAKRMLEAERRANALPVKLSVPLVLSVFPVLLIFILLPMAIRIKNAMF